MVVVVVVVVVVIVVIVIVLLLCYYCLLRFMSCVAVTLQFLRVVLLIGAPVRIPVIFHVVGVYH